MGMDLAFGLGLSHSAQDLDLVSYLPQDAQDLPVPIQEPQGVIFQPFLLAPIYDVFAGGSEVLSGYPREEVVDDLEVETAVNEVQVRWTDDVHCCPGLTMDEGFV